MRTLTHLRANAASSALRAMIVFALLSPLCATGCEDQTQPSFDGGAGLRLLVLDPPGSQIGLRYGKSIELRVRCVRDDADQTPIADAPVRFAIFDDPVGSTLSRDSVVTDETGLATVTLTAGNQEGAFRVHASAGGAEDAELAISISELEFVEIDAELADPLPTSGGRNLVAALFVDRSCASLTPGPKLTGASRSLSASSTAMATLTFVNLLSRTYALVARVETNGRLLAYGCVDLARTLLPPGAHVTLPVGLRPVRPTVVGGFDVDSELGSSRSARPDVLFADVDVIDRCPGHLGQLLLDELVTRVGSVRAAQIAAHRGAAQPSTLGSSTVSCRPAMAASADSLDLELGDLVSALGSPGELRADLLADLDGVLQSARLRSHLELAVTTRPLDDGAASPDRYAASHHALQLDFALGGAVHSEVLEQLGTPITGADDVEAQADEASVRLGAHALPIGLSQAWGAALSALSISVKLPALAEPTLGGWAAAAALAAERNAKTGCAAIEDLLCERTDPTGCGGTLLSACADAVAAVTSRLDAPFAAPTPLVLEGGATLVDLDGDLVAERLDPGQWTASGVFEALLSFDAMRTTP